MSHDDRTLQSPEHVANLVLRGFRERSPFGFDGLLRDLANLGLQISEALVARTVIGGLAIVGTLSFRGHIGAVQRSLSGDKREYRIREEIGADRLKDNLGPAYYAMEVLYGATVEVVAVNKSNAISARHMPASPDGA